ncbi:MAG: TspO/MBR family protein [bacterium]
MKLTLPWAKKPKDNYLVLVGLILASQAAGGIGSIFTFSAIPTWYFFLNKPFFSPPNWIFAPVWTILYTLMGISAYLVWRKYQFGDRSRAFWHVSLAQLALNILWSILFFGLKFTGLAFIEILAMWYFIARSIQEGKKLSLWSSYLLYPYLFWVSFATLLNLAS